MPEDAQKKQHRYYEKTVSSYDEMHGDSRWHNTSLRYTSAFIDLLGISSVLDIGCGTGRGVEFFLENRPGLRIKGLEPVQALINEAVKKGIPKQLIVRGRGESLPFEDDSFDSVIELGVLHHVENPELVVTEMMRVAKKAIFISDSNRFGQGKFFLRWLKLFLYKCGLWGVVNFLKTKGRGYSFSEGDGLTYSYSVFDTYSTLYEWSDRLILIPIKSNEPEKMRAKKRASWLHPLLTAETILVCAIRREA